MGQERTHYDRIFKEDWKELTDFRKSIQIILHKFIKHHNKAMDTNHFHTFAVYIAHLRNYTSQ